jgi:kynurenine formamidase
LSLLVAPNLPCYWSAGMPPVQINHDARIGPTSAYNRDILTIDEHSGTQWDAPAHFIPKPETGLPHAGEMGYVTADKVPVTQMCGEACVIDCGPLPAGAAVPAIGLSHRAGNRPGTVCTQDAARRFSASGLRWQADQPAGR